MKTKVRYHDLDLLKALSIFAVCIYHFWYGGFVFESSVAQFIFDAGLPYLSSCVPLFFMVNGALLLNRDRFDSKKHYKGLLHMFLQYYVWYALTIVILGILFRYDFLAQGKAHLLNIFLFHMPVSEVPATHLWFIPALCCFYVIYPFFRSLFAQEKTDPNARMGLIVFMGMIYVFDFLFQDFDNFKIASDHLRSFATYALDGFYPFIGHMGTLMFYFLLGGIFHRYRDKTAKIPAILCVLMILVGLGLSYATVCVKYAHEIYYDPVFEGFGTHGTLLCTAGTFLLAGKVNYKFLEKVKLLPLIHAVGDNTMSIYYTHWILGYIIAEFITIPVGPVWNVLHALVLVAAGTVFGLVMKKVPVLKGLVAR